MRSANRNSAEFRYFQAPMDRYPYHKPQRWWPSRASLGWMRLWRTWRRWQQVHDYGVERIDVLGLDRVREAIHRDEGILITPNHAGHADSFLLYDALERLPRPPHVMTAYQVFELLPWLQRLAYQHHGCFSVNREANDLAAFRWSVRVLAETSDPLVIFPEGEVYHLNDRVTPFRDGTLTIAMAAVRRGGRPVSCFPCGLKCFYIDDPTPALLPVMEQLERRLGLSPLTDAPLVDRLRRFLEQAVRARELQYRGSEATGTIKERIAALADEILSKLESPYGLSQASDFLPERVRHLRHASVEQSGALEPHDPRLARYARDLEDIFV
ncbi:MAG: 1-acyl-sn-glycerol-3-phosphate acyltransferase, partial [Pirellulales bacterium]